MKHFIFTFFILTFFIPATNAQFFGGPRNDYGYHVQQTSDNGYVIVGSYQSTLKMIYVLKLDSCANLEWNKFIGDSVDISASCISQTPDSGFIIMGTQRADSANSYQRAVLIRLNAAGDSLYSRSYNYGTYWNNGYYCHVLPSGNYLLEMNSNPYGLIPYRFIETDTSGNILWTSVVDSFGGPNTPSKICLTHDGGIAMLWGGTSVVGGAEIRFTKMDSMGVIQFTKKYYDNYMYPMDLIGSGICETRDNGFFIVGQKYHGFGNSTTVSFKVDASGNGYWGGGNSQLVFQAARALSTPDSAAVFAGETLGGSATPTLRKVNNSGATIWTKTYNNIWGTVSFTDVNRQGNIVIVGSGLNPDSMDVWLLIADNAGNQVSCFSTGIENNLPEPLTIYPNPTTNQFAISSWQLEKGELEIFNSLGVKVYSAEFSRQSTVDCRQFGRGIYFVRISNSEKALTQELVIE